MFFKKFKRTIISFLLVFISIPLNIYAYSSYVVASGQNVGIKVNYDGVLIIGMYEVNNEYPAIKAGLKIGDRITKVNGNNINNIEDLISNLNGDIVDIEYIRNDKVNNTRLSLINDGNSYKTGLYVKDSILGIGTLTYIDPNTNIYGALGHEISDSSTGKLVNIKSGEIFESSITSIDPSVKGLPGSKNAKFNFNNTKGVINENTNKGIFGIYSSNYDKNNLYKVGNIDDIKLGKANILTVINNNDVQRFDINILKVSDNNTKSILFEVTDKELLEKSNGIVQGMSGSPIIQDDKIIGAVTHVVVDNPNKGYGILITSMLEEGEN